MKDPREINCEEIFRNAYEKRYTWDSGFKGYKGKFTYILNQHVYEGEFLLSEDFKPEIKNIEDEKIKKSIASQLFEVCIHRVKREFHSIHSENNFNFLKSSKNGIEMRVSGRNEGDKYRVKNDCINMVYRKIHGTIIEIFVEEFLDTGIGVLSKRYSSQPIDPDTLKAKSQKLEYEDEFINIDEEDHWILNSRTIKYLNQNQEEEIQKFVFKDLSLLK